MTTATQDTTTTTKTSNLVSTTASTITSTILNSFVEFKRHTSFIVRCLSVGTFYGALLGAGVPATPLLYRTANGNMQMQQKLISSFFSVGFVTSIVPYAFLFDNASSGSSRYCPQFYSIFSPMYIGMSCWLGGHLYYPGRFVIMYEEKGVKLREFLRLNFKTALAFHRLHIPFVLAWSLILGLVTKPFRETKKKNLVADVADVDEKK